MHITSFQFQKSIQIPRYLIVDIRITWTSDLWTPELPGKLILKTPGPHP